MKEPEAILVAGDTHGDPKHFVYLFERAINNDVDAILQVGDFGFWEHVPEGYAYLEVLSELAIQNDMPLFWIDGNHESHIILREKYGPGGTHYKPTPEGFWEIRPGVYYIPRGTRWVWSGRHLMGLGGAYSVDKDYRLAREQGVECPAWGWTSRHVAMYPPTGQYTQWWPQEEITDEDVRFALQDLTPLDILFTHDKPRASTPGWNRKDLPECWPNQDKIQTVVKTLTPKMLIHGHLHYPYEDQIRCGDDDKFTYVVGLNCNPDEFDEQGNPNKMFKVIQESSWCRLQLAGDTVDPERTDPDVAMV